MDTLSEQLEQKLREWRPELAVEVRSRVMEIIQLADEDALDLCRSRAVEQDVLDLIDDEYRLPDGRGSVTVLAR